jgi:hypothetical protein
VLHVHRPHPHLPHPHVDPDFGRHPWRMVPVLFASLAMLVVVVIFLTFLVAKIVTGHAY